MCLQPYTVIIIPFQDLTFISDGNPDYLKGVCLFHSTAFADSAQKKETIDFHITNLLYSFRIDISARIS